LLKDFGKQPRELGPLDRACRTIRRTVENKIIAPLLWLVVGCVPITRYEEAESAAAVEAEARRRAALELESTRQRLSELEATLQARDAELEARQRTLDEQQLASSISDKQRQENASLVEQLRGELSRTGDHLKSYSEEKARLERELSAAQQAVPPLDPASGPAPEAVPATGPAQVAAGSSGPVPAAGAEPAPPAPSEPRQPAADFGALARGVSAALAAVGLDQKVKVTTRSDGVELKIAEASLFEEDSAALRPSMAALFTAAARLSGADPSLSGSLREADHDARLSPALGEERRAQLAASLKQNGLDARIRLESLDEPVSGAPRAYVLALRSSGPPQKTGG
jgi:flagellar motor protein MotB